MIEVKKLNLKISSSQNYDKDFRNLLSMNLKEEIGIKDEIIKLYSNLNK